MSDKSYGHKRIWFLYFCIILVASILIGRLYVLQIVKGNDFRDQAEGQYKKPTSQFDRNDIYFTEKNGNLVSAATVRTGYILELNPKMIKDANSAYNKLSEVIVLDKTNFLEKATKKNDS